MQTAHASGSTQVHGGDEVDASIPEVESTQDLLDLRVLQAWIREQRGCNTTGVVDAFATLAITFLERPSNLNLTEFAEPWSRIQGLYRTPRDPIGPTAMSQHVKTKVMTDWFKAREADYSSFCDRNGAKMLQFVELPGKPLTYGFRHLKDIVSETPYVTKDAVLRWRREPVPESHMTPLGKRLFPDNRYTMIGWRWNLLIGTTIIQFIAITILMVSGVACLALSMKSGPAVFLNAITFFGLAALIVIMSMKPAIREGDMRTHPARMGLVYKGGDAWVDRTNVNLGKSKIDAGYRPEAAPYRELVRWKADCPICGSPLELKTDSPVMKGLVGCCVESPDEHSFSFDRVTLEGRPLRARPATPA